MSLHCAYYNTDHDDALPTGCALQCGIDDLQADEEIGWHRLLNTQSQNVEAALAELRRCEVCRACVERNSDHPVVKRLRHEAQEATPEKVVINIKRHGEKYNKALALCIRLGTALDLAKHEWADPPRQLERAAELWNLLAPVVHDLLEEADK